MIPKFKVGDICVDMKTSISHTIEITGIEGMNYVYTLTKNGKTEQNWNYPIIRFDREVRKLTKT